MRGVARGRHAGLVAGLVAALGFATSGPVVKPLFEAGWTPGGAMLFRLGIGAVLLIGPALHQLRGRYGLLRDEWRILLLFGTVCVGGCSTLYYLAVERLPVAVALLVEYTAPLMLLGLAWLRTRRAPATPVLVGAALAMGGLVLVLDLTGSLDLDPVGLVFATVAAIANAAYWAITARPLAVPPVTLAGTGMVIGWCTVAVLTLAGVLPVAVPAVQVEVLGAHVPWFVPVLVVGAVPTGFAYGVSAVSVRLLGERVASFVALSEVLFSVVLAWVLLGEAPLGVQLVGAALVVAGVALVRRGAGTSEHDEQPTAAAGALTAAGTSTAAGTPAVPVGSASVPSSASGSLVAPEPRPGELDRQPA